MTRVSKCQVCEVMTDQVHKEVNRCIIYNGILTTLECHYANHGCQHKREKVDLSVEIYING